MKRDTLKTLAGLIIIGGIVVATFLYGNSQRQAQLKHDADVKKQQAAKVQEQTKAASTTPTTAATPAATPTPTPKVAANTAPVKSPASNTLQGSGAGGSALGSAASPTPAASNTPVAGATGSNPLPETGPEMFGLLGVSSIAFMLMKVRGSRKAVVDAARNHK